MVDLIGEYGSNFVIYVMAMVKVGGRGLAYTAPTTLFLHGHSVHHPPWASSQYGHAGASSRWGT